MPALHLSPRLLGILCVFTGTFCFASKGILIKLAYQYGITATPLLTLRMLFALPFYAATALWLHQQQLTPLNKGDGWKIAGLGLLSYYGSSLLDFMGLEYISAGLERLILYVYPTLVLLMLAYWKKEKITRTTQVALAIVYSGMLLVFIQDLKDVDEVVVSVADQLHKFLYLLGEDFGLLHHVLWLGAHLGQLVQGWRKLLEQQFDGTEAGPLGRFEVEHALK